MPYYALLYDLVDDYLERRGEFRHEHLGLAHDAAANGELLLAGAMTTENGVTDSALLVWSVAGTDSIERFVHADPYVRNGLVRRWQIREWHVVAGADAATAP